MKQLMPFNNITDAISNLDNGGRFYDVFSKSNDGEISKAELGKLAGVFNDKQKMILFLDLSMSNFDTTAKSKIISSLSQDLQQIYNKHKADILLPSEASIKGQLANNTIVTGIPKLIDSRTDFNGFIIFPLMAGKVMTMMIIPIIEKYDVYKIRDNESSKSFLIAHDKEMKRLPEKMMKVAGVLKELKDNKEEEKSSKMYLEAMYFMDVII